MKEDDDKGSFEERLASSLAQREQEVLQREETRKSQTISQSEELRIQGERTGVTRLLVKSADILKGKIVAVMAPPGGVPSSIRYALLWNEEHLNNGDTSCDFIFISVDAVRDIRFYDQSSKNRQQSGWKMPPSFSSSPYLGSFIQEVTEVEYSRDDFQRFKRSDANLKLLEDRLIESIANPSHGHYREPFTAKYRYTPPEYW